MPQVRLPLHYYCTIVSPLFRSSNILITPSVPFYFPYYYYLPLSSVSVLIYPSQFSFQYYYLPLFRFSIIIICFRAHSRRARQTGFSGESPHPGGHLPAATAALHFRGARPDPRAKPVQPVPGDDRAAPPPTGQHHHSGPAERQAALAAAAAGVGFPWREFRRN